MSVLAFEIDARNKHLVLVIGLGLVGSEIATQLRQRASNVDALRSNTLKWDSIKQVVTVLDTIVEHYKPQHLDLLWCAGKGGFSATEKEMQAEHTLFRAVLTSLKNQRPFSLTINFISSAGGIYENSGYVQSLEDISPSRPYAHAKLSQEALLNELQFEHRIYRLSSVYGLGPANSRTGLIKNMLHCARENQSMTIYAGQDTLRDYIYHTDVAKLIVQDICDKADSGLRLLASGRAVSINVLLNLVKNITSRPVRATYIATNANQQNIVFSKKIISVRRPATSLEEGIRIMNMHLQSHNAGY